VQRCLGTREPAGAGVEEDAVVAGPRRIKSVEDSIRDTDEPEHRLR
jgi:hypothetical protein